MVTKDGIETVTEWEKVKHFPAFSTIQDWLIEAGFEIESAAGNFAGDPITDETDRAVIWAKKLVLPNK